MRFFRVLYLLHKHQFRLCNCSGNQLVLVSLHEHFYVLRKNKVELFSLYFTSLGHQSAHPSVLFKLWHGCVFTDMARLSCWTNCHRYSLLSPQMRPALELVRCSACDFLPDNVCPQSSWHLLHYWFKFTIAQKVHLQSGKHEDHLWCPFIFFLSQLQWKWLKTYSNTTFGGFNLEEFWLVLTMRCSGSWKCSMIVNSVKLFWRAISSWIIIPLLSSKYFSIFGT